MDLCDSSTDGFMDTTALTKTIAFSFKGINFDEKILHKEVFFTDKIHFNALSCCGIKSICNFLLSYFLLRLKFYSIKIMPKILFEN